MKEKIKKWFDQGLWFKNQVRNAVTKGSISIQDYKEITGDDF